MNQTETLKREQLKVESRKDAGLSQDTDMARAYETGYQHGWSAALKHSPAVYGLLKAAEEGLGIAEYEVYLVKPFKEAIEVYERARDE